MANEIEIMYRLYWVIKDSEGHVLEEAEHYEDQVRMLFDYEMLQKEKDVIEVKVHVMVPILGWKKD